MKIAVGRVVTYSASTAIALTHACANHCRYCGFRDEGDGLLPLDAIQTIATRARKDGTAEVLLISGENADRLPLVKSALESMGLSSMVAWTAKVAEYLLGLGLLPHINIGVLDYAGLRDLKEVAASMGLMMEGDYGSLGAAVHPQKDFVRRLRNLEWAGQLEIPFTTGILMGLGESQNDRLRSIEAIADCGRAYGHIQEIILQNYVPNGNSSVTPGGLSVAEITELITAAREGLPGISIQIPPNLNPDWPDLLALGASDLGGIGRGTDPVNEASPWPAQAAIRDIVTGKGYHLRKRLPIYAAYYRRGWYSARVGTVIEKWVQNNDEYRYYTEPSS